MKFPNLGFREGAPVGQVWIQKGLWFNGGRVGSLVWELREG